MTPYRLLYLKKLRLYTWLQRELTLGKLYDTNDYYNTNDYHNPLFTTRNQFKIVVIKAQYFILNFPLKGT